MRLELNSRAKQAVSLASKLSKRLNHSYVGTEHLLLGLLLTKEGAASKILYENGAKEEDIGRLIAEQIAMNGALLLEEKHGYTPKLQEIIEGAKKHIQK